MRRLLIAWLGILPLVAFAQEDSGTGRFVIRADSTGKGEAGSFDRIGFNSPQAQKAHTVSAVVETEPGVQVNRFGALGTYSTLSVRGAGPNQSGVYIDGVPLNSALGGPTNLENLPFGLFRGAELYKSYTPVHLPGSHFGGALDLIPGFAETGKRYVLVDGYGNTLQGGGIGAGAALPWTLQYLNAQGSRNRYDYIDDNGTRLGNTADDRIRQRRNEDFKQIGYTSLYRHNLDGHSLRFFGDVFFKERGLPGRIGAPLNNVRLDEDRLLFNLKHNTAINNRLVISDYVSGQTQSNRVSDPKDELSFGLTEAKRRSNRFEANLSPEFILAAGRFRINTSHHGALTTLTIGGQELANRNEIENGLALNWQLLQSTAFLVQGKAIHVKDNPKPGLDSIFIEDQNLSARTRFLYTAMGKLTVSLTGGTPKARPKTEAKETAKTSKESAELYVLVSQGRRMPSVTETYGNGQLVLANPGIRPELARSIVTGGAYSIRMQSYRFSSELAGFITRSEKLIVFLPNSERTVRAENIGAADTMGVETEAAFGYGWFDAVLRLTFTRAVDDSRLDFYNGKFIPFQPAYAGNLYLQFGPKQIKGFADLKLSGSVFRDRYNTEQKFLKNREVADTGVVYYAGDNSGRFTFVVKNILDTQSSDVFGYPLPGRIFEIQWLKKFI